MSLRIIGFVKVIEIRDNHAHVLTRIIGLNYESNARKEIKKKLF